MVNVWNITCNATGLVEYDWTVGEYSGVGQIFNLGFPDVCVVGFILVTIFIVGVMFLYFLLQKKSLKYSHKKFFLKNLFTL